MNYIDTHAHIYSEEFETVINEVVLNGQLAGVNKILLPNVNSHSIDGMLELEKQFPEVFYPMMGLHPTYIKENYLDELKVIEDWLYKRKFIAVGEIGIDLYWDKSFLAQQQFAFQKQIEWALDLDLPIVIHARDAFSEIFEILDLYRGKSLRGVFHSFSGGVQEVDKILSFGGFKMAINGIVTFKNSKLDSAIIRAGVENLMLEADSPYLSPMPHRGKVNKPEYIPHISQKIASILNITEVEVAKVTTGNAIELFQLNK